MRKHFRSQATILFLALTLMCAATSAFAGVTVSSPSAGSTVGSPVHFTGTATSDTSHPITAMRIYLDYTSVYLTSNSSIDTYLPVAAGSHNLTMQAWDSGGTVYKSSRTFTVGTATAPAPTPTTSTGVTISSPSAGATVGSPVNFVMSAKSATSYPITAIQIYVDNVLAYKTSASSLNTSLALSTGNHYIVGQAWDGSGKIYKTPINISVSSTAPAPTPTPTPTSPSTGQVSVSMTPTSVSLGGSQSQQFNATVSGTTNTGVTWSVNGVQGGNSSYGVVNSAGLYTAPACPGTSSVTVRATSAYDSSKTASANVSLNGGSSGSGNYYVAPNGSDSNSGSACSPWATIQHANAVVGAGATVHVAPGNYYINSGISTNKSGSSTAPIKYLSDSRWGAKIIANSTIDTCWDNTGSNVIVEGFDLTEASGSCRIGILNEGSNVRISSNRVHDLRKAAAIATCDGGPGAAGIDAYSSSASGADIVGNVVFHIGDYTSHSCRFIQGIYTAMKNVRVMNNVTYQNASFGLNMGAYSSSNTIANNTAFANGYGGLFLDTYSTNALVVNNILYNNNGQGINCYSPGPVTIQNNLIYGHSTNFTNNGSCSQSGTINSAPQFVNYQANGSGDYHLTSSSPGLNQGTSNGAPKVDMMGGARPIGSGYDVGAYETGNSPAAWPW